MTGTQRTFSATVNQWFETLWILRVDEIDECGVDPSTGFNRVQTADDNVELHVIVVILVLNLAKVSSKPNENLQ